jgi:hypothetical protein
MRAARRLRRICTCGQRIERRFGDELGTPRPNGALRLDPVKALRSQ